MKRNFVVVRREIIVWTSRHSTNDLTESAFGSGELDIV